MIMYPCAPSNSIALGTLNESAMSTDAELAVAANVLKLKDKHVLVIDGKKVFVVCDGYASFCIKKQRANLGSGAKGVKTRREMTHGVKRTKRRGPPLIAMPNMTY